MSRRHLKSLEEAIARSFLPNTVDIEISEFLDQNPTCTDPTALPEGRLKTEIMKIFDQHVHIGDPSSCPTVARALESRTPQPPSVVELFLALIAVYPSIRSECIRAASAGFYRADCYEPSFAEFLETLRLMNWTCVGAIGPCTLPTVPFLAALAHSMGLRILMPRNAWVCVDPPRNSRVRYAAALRRRSHVWPAALLSDLRSFDCSLTSFAGWALSRPLTLVGPGTTHPASVRDCFLLTLAGLRAGTNSFCPLSLASRPFLDGIPAFPGILSIVGDDFAESDSDSSLPDLLTDSGNECPREDYPPSTSTTEGA